MRVQIRNQQGLKKIRISKIRKKIEKALDVLGVKEEVSFLFCDNKFMKGLNKSFFNKESPTDVIAFPLKDNYIPQFLGEVVISVEEVLKNSKIYHTSFLEELLLCSIHGILHLLGFKDVSFKEKREMYREQERVLKLIKDDC
ncbi:MAG: rRNA maturation RNase YbeY [Candidatus Omnitrophota bacterium]|nr:MAG: rRNA maturation RNase YbeY [Candidatus Omnitrophota bacterium]